MNILIENWQVVLLAILVAARAIVSLLPSTSPAVKIFGWIDLVITAIVGGDRRKKNRNK